MRRRSISTLRALLCGTLIIHAATCSRGPQRVVLTADMPLHLEDHLDAAKFTEVAGTDPTKTTLRKPVEWRFDQPQPDWKATPLWNPPFGAPVLTRTGDGLRITLGSQLKTTASGPLRGAIRVDVPNWDRNDWAEIVIRARAEHSSSVNVLGLGFNLREGRGEAGAAAAPPFRFGGEESAVVPDGNVRPYRLRINVGGGNFDGTWRQLFLYVGSAGAPGSIDVLSISVVPKGAVPAPTTVEWRFDQPQPDWKPVLRRPTPDAAAREDVIERAGGVLRVLLPESSRRADKVVHGGTYVDLPGWRREEWAYIIVRARTTSVTNMTVGLNPRQGVVPPNAIQESFARAGGSTPIVSDGSVQTYQVRPEWGGGAGSRIGPWLRFALEFRASEPGSIDIESVKVVPIDALYAADRAGSRSIAVSGVDYRRGVFAHAPGRLEYRVRVPEGGRLHASLGVLDRSVDFSVTAQSTKGVTATIFRETHADPEQWADRTIDLSTYTGQTITLGFETNASNPGAVAFWGAPTLTGARRTGKPNVILYIIDAGGADFMSVYGYNRRTTPNLEHLAAQGAVFEHAYSQASWTKPSVRSFMTSLQNSVLGFTGNEFDPLPEQAVTMAERFHRSGYQTAVFTGNPLASTASGLERGVDWMPNPQKRERDARSSVILHDAFWRWRERTPGEPYWVHFQTTDVHAVGPNGLNLSDDVPIAPFAGLFVSPQDVSTLREWSTRVQAGGGRITSDAFTTGGISRVAFLSLYQGMYDQQMAHNDYQLGRLVDRLKASGEWQNTVLIVASDHSVGSTVGDSAIGMLDSPPPSWMNPAFRPSTSRIPLIVVWPGHIAGGQRFNDAVSMIDVLPTVLDLTGLPRPDVMQGQSLAPLLRGEPGWTPQPVILEEVWMNPSTGQIRRGSIEVVDGRWGASMQLVPRPKDLEAGRPWPVMLFDLWNDPMCVGPVNEQQPDLLDKYTKFLIDQWKAHQELAKQFKPGPKVALTPEQLERLRSLGYIR